MNICVSVLHYERFNITKRCVDSLLELNVPKDTSFHIVIVDNGSQNNSYDALLERYKEYGNVRIIKSLSNEGFARGNNIAYVYMKKIFHCDLGVFLNNDTEIIDKSFLKKLIFQYKKRPFDVLSIDVYDPHVDQHQSPLCVGDNLSSYAFNEKQNFERNLHLTVMQKGILAGKERISQILYPMTIFRKFAMSHISKYCRSAKWEEPLEDVVPQGACVIFGPRYFERFDDAFYPLTTMYFEECILKVRCDKNGLKIRYTPNLQILHHHHEFSREYIKKNTVSSVQHKAKCMVDSYEKLEDFMNSI